MYVLTYSKDINRQDEEVKAEREAHGTEQEGVDPWLHDQQRLVLGKRVQSVAHLDGDEDGQGHGHGFVCLCKNRLK